MPRKTKAQLAAESRSGVALDWLLNSRHCGDPEIQSAYWGLADGYLTREQADKGFVDSVSVVDYVNACEGGYLDKHGCVHCGRTDDGRGGHGLWARIGQMRVCHTDAPGRPDCYHLVTVYSDEHPLVGCASCTPQPGTGA